MSNDAGASSVVDQFAAVEEHLRRLDDRAPSRVVIRTEVGEGDAAHAAIRVRAEHARQRQDREVWLAGRLVALVVADEHSTNERFHRGTLALASREHVHDLTADLVEEVAHGTDDLPKQASVPRAALAVAPEAQHEGGNLAVSTASIRRVRYGSHARRSQGQFVEVASEDGVADVEAPGLRHLQRRTARSRLPAHGVGGWFHIGGIKHGEVFALADADDPARDVADDGHVRRRDVRPPVPDGAGGLDVPADHRLGLEVDALLGVELPLSGPVLRVVGHEPPLARWAQRRARRDDLGQLRVLGPALLLEHAK